MISRRFTFANYVASRKIAERYFRGLTRDVELLGSVESSAEEAAFLLRTEAILRDCIQAN